MQLFHHHHLYQWQYTTCFDWTVNVHQSCVPILLVLTDSKRTPTMHTNTLLVPTNSKCTPIISFWNLNHFTTTSDSKCTPVMCIQYTTCSDRIYYLFLPTANVNQASHSLPNTLLVLTVNVHQSYVAIPGLKKNHDFCFKKSDFLFKLDFFLYRCLNL